MKLIFTLTFLLICSLTFAQKESEPHSFYTTLIPLFIGAGLTLLSTFLIKGWNISKEKEHFFRLQQASNHDFNESVEEESYLIDNQFQIDSVLVIVNGLSKKFSKILIKNPRIGFT